MAVASLPRNFQRIREVARMDFDAINFGEFLRKSKACDNSNLKCSRWLQRQLPVRYARRVEDFMQLPHVVVSNPHFNAALNRHLRIFDAIDSFPDISSLEHAVAFRRLLASQLARKCEGKQLADGYRQVRNLFPHVTLDTFLHDLFVSGMACDILMENFVSLNESHGVVKQNVNLFGIARDLADELMGLTSQAYGASPEIVFRGNVDCTLDYIPGHAFFMLNEVLMNAMRATVERHLVPMPSGSCDKLGFGKLRSASLPSIVVELQRGDRHVIVKVSDQGGGLSKESQRDAWRYGWSTATSWPSSSPWTSALPTARISPAGSGFGLPLARLHAQFFGGDIFMQAMPGHGTDMYLLLTHLGEGSASTEADDPASTLGVHAESNGPSCLNDFASKHVAEASNAISAPPLWDGWLPQRTSCMAEASL